MSSESPQQTPKIAAKRARSPAHSTALATSPCISHGSVVLTDLPADMKQVYTRVIRRFFPAQHKQISEATIMEESDNATLTVEVPSKEMAQLLHKRLQNAKVCGRRWKVQYMPASQTVPAENACLVDCLLVPAASRALVERSLAAVPGFLAFAEAPQEAPQRQHSDEAEAEAEDDGQEEQKDRFLLSFVDEGSALHARAVLSGRLVGSSGVRMFLERRR